MGVVGSKSRSLGHISENSCLHCRGHSFCQIFLKIGQNVCIDDLLNPFESSCGHAKYQVSSSNLTSI